MENSGYQNVFTQYQKVLIFVFESIRFSAVYKNEVADESITIFNIFSFWKYFLPIPIGFDYNLLPVSSLVS